MGALEHGYEGAQEKVTGGGWIPGDSRAPKRKRNFGFNVHFQADNVWGQLQFIDHGTKMKVHSEEMLALAIYGETEAEFSGTCSVDHTTGYSFKCVVEDNGEPGRGVDRFGIEVWDQNGNPYYSAGDLLGGGNIQIHDSDDGEVVQHGFVADGVPPSDHNDTERLNRTDQTHSEAEPVLGSYPNPFSASTTIRHSLAHSSDVRLDIYDLTGKSVRTLVDDRLDAGYGVAKWDGRDEQGNTVPTGTYIYRLVTGDSSRTGKVIMVK
jgi:hypothetical protein